MENYRTQTSDLESQIADFVLQYGEGIYQPKDYPYIRQYIRVHLSYGTIMVMKDKDKIIAACRWNQPTATHANILDFVVHPDYRNMNLSKNMFIRAKEAMPMLETISFERGKKYPNRPKRVYELSRWVKEKSWEAAQVLQ